MNNLEDELQAALPSLCAVDDAETLNAWMVKHTSLLLLRAGIDEIPNHVLHIALLEFKDYPKAPYFLGGFYYRDPSLDLPEGIWPWYQAAGFNGEHFAEILQGTPLKADERSFEPRPTQRGIDVILYVSDFPNLAVMHKLSGGERTLHPDLPTML